MGRMRKRMEAMLGVVNRSLKVRREAARNETELEECRNALRGDAEQRELWAERVKHGPQ